MKINEKIKELDETRKKISELKQELVDKSTEVFQEFQKDIFNKYPQLESFGWTQYTPYFNDGDTCIFSPHTNYLKINDEWVDDSAWVGENITTNWGKWNQQLRIYEGRVEEPNPNYNEELSKANSEIVDFLSKFDDDFYLSKFGDHSEITITKDSLTIEDYDHD